MENEEKPCRMALREDTGNRPLTPSERSLARYMLEHGEPGALDFLEQLEQAEIAPWRCPCGCASVNFHINGHPRPRPSAYILGDYVYGPPEMPAGIFIFACNGVLGGIEVYGLGGDAPGQLPAASELRPLLLSSSRLGEA